MMLHARRLAATAARAVRANATTTAQKLDGWLNTPFLSLALTEAAFHTRLIVRHVDCDTGHTLYY